MRPFAVLLVAICGCGHVASYARTVADIAVGVADVSARIPDACDRAIAACDGDAPCVTTAAERCRQAVRAAESASTSARAIIDVLRLDDGDGGAETGGPIARAVKAILDAWRALVRAARAIGVEVP